MAYINFQNCTKEQYDSKIYSQNNTNKAKIFFNNNELLDADNYLEKITFQKRILPENGKKVFSLDNFISEEVEIIIHDIDLAIIQDKVRIELGTIIDNYNNYEYIPMGIYNIQDTPTRNDDKITIKLRDNACLFDFYYNAKPLIDRLGGSATKLQILQDICNQAGVVCNVVSFLGDSDEVGIYDNTIKGRMYVAYLAEQAGCIAKIDRNGSLVFIPLNNLYTQRIPLSVVSKYIEGTPYEIQRVVYELGTIKFETSSDETLQTFYISSNNPYISNQEQVNNIFNQVLKNFEINSVEILKEIIGNPSIDGYDLIQVYDDESENDVVVFTTLANNTLIYNGKFKSKYKTEIGLEERKENTTNTGEAVFQKTIKSEIDLLEGEVRTTVEQVGEQNTKIATINENVNSILAQISDIADITTSAEDTDAQIELDDINVSEPITIRVHPVVENISYDYPFNDYPQNDYSKVRILRFINKSIYEETTDTKYTNYRNYYVKTRAVDEYVLLVKGTDYQVGDIISGTIYQNKEYDYEIPDDLLYYDNETYDEFQLDYGDGTAQTKICQVVKKCKWNADGSVGLLTTPQTDEYEYPLIELDNGDYDIKLMGYSTGYIFARLMASNIYTNQFATKVEMNSAIEIATGQINLVVSQKLDSSRFNSAEIMLAINNDGTSSASINADKININGVINAINNNGSTTINGNKITTGTITATQVSSDIITTTNFSAQNINADNITGGTLSVDRIQANSITSSKIAYNTITNSQIADNTISTEKINNINAEKITAGTIDANVINIVNLNASNISGGTINADNVSIINLNANNITAGTLNVDRIPNLSANKITSGTMSANRINGGSISGVSISIGRYFKVSSTGLAEMTTDGGFLTTGTTSSPYVSALNVAYGSGGISFRSSNGQSSAGNQRASISLSSSNGNLVLSATNYVMCGGSGEGYQIATKTGGYPSTKNLKTNIEKIKYDDIYEDMKNMNIYEYDYKYDGIKEKNKHDFGFIIDELEETNILSKYILNYDRYGKIKNNKLIAYKKGLDAEDFNPKKDGYNFKYKEWDRDTYFKLSLLMIKSLQNKIEKLEEKL